MSESGGIYQRQGTYDAGKVWKTKGNIRHGEKTINPNGTTEINLNNGKRFNAKNGIRLELKEKKI